MNDDDPAIAARAVQTPALVWVRHNGRLWPQIWRAPVGDAEHYWRGRIAAAHPVPPHLRAHLMLADALDVFAKLFPPPPLPDQPRVKLS